MSDSSAASPSPDPNQPEQDQAALQASAPATTSPDSLADRPASDAPASDAPSFGWNPYAERTNGRFAMVGFVALLLLELFTRQDFWSWIGF